MKATWMLGVNHLGELIQQCNNEIWWNQNETQKYLDPNPLLIYNLYHLQKIPVQCPKGPATIVSVISIIRPHQKKTFAFHRPKYNPHNWSLEAVEVFFWVTKKFHIKIIRIRNSDPNFHSSCFYLEMTELFMTHWIADRKKKDNISLAAETSRFYSVKLEGSLGDVGEFGTCSGWMFRQVSVTRKLSTPIEKPRENSSKNPEQIQELEIK